MPKSLPTKNQELLRFIERGMCPLQSTRVVVLKKVVTRIASFYYHTPTLGEQQRAIFKAMKSNKLLTFWYSLSTQSLTHLIQCHTCAAASNAFSDGCSYFYTPAIASSICTKMVCIIQQITHYTPLKSFNTCRIQKIVSYF